MASMSSPQRLEKSSLNYISLLKHEDKLQWFHNTSFKLTILFGEPQNLNIHNNIHNWFQTTMIRCTIFYNYLWNPTTLSHDS